MECKNLCKKAGNFKIDIKRKMIPKDKNKMGGGTMECNNGKEVLPGDKMKKMGVAGEASFIIDSRPYGVRGTVTNLVPWIDNDRNKVLSCQSHHHHAFRIILI